MALSISERITDEFDIVQIPFIGCDFDLLYHQIVEILPSETISFNEFEFDKNIACEMICASICHQMNWVFLRQAVLDTTKKILIGLNVKI